MMCNHENLYCNKCNPGAVLFVLRTIDSIAAENKALRAEIAELQGSKTKPEASGVVDQKLTLCGCEVCEKKAKEQLEWGDEVVNQYPSSAPEPRCPNEILTATDINRMWAEKSKEWQKVADIVIEPIITRVLKILEDHAKNNPGASEGDQGCIEKLRGIEIE